MLKLPLASKVFVAMGVQLAMGNAKFVDVST
jgi:hypothetical protein